MAHATALRGLLGSSAAFGASSSRRCDSARPLRALHATRAAAASSSPVPSAHALGAGLPVCATTINAAKAQRSGSALPRHEEEDDDTDGLCVLLSSCSLAPHCVACSHAPVLGSVGALAPPPPGCRWRRVMLKISGEALSGEQGFGIDADLVLHFAAEVAAMALEGVQARTLVLCFPRFAVCGRVASVRSRAHAGCCGGWRRQLLPRQGPGGSWTRPSQRRLHGHACNRHERAPASSCAGKSRSAHARADCDRHEGDCGTLYSASSHPSLGEGPRGYFRGWHWRVTSCASSQARLTCPRCRRAGNPFFTTDTGAALRAAEINAEALLKATKVDGVFDCDPKKFSTAVMHTHLSYSEVIQKPELAVMDTTAITLCAENAIPVVVFNLFTQGNIRRALRGEAVGTRVGGGEWEPIATAPASGQLGTSAEQRR